ncbi:hypothetical protein PI23P_02022 [Polaribacter irgensii 23-P]|uniref:Uncharacterized protein n=1 Tax=Polaribacter irgensii 23-P TaxID=313594 RepID=A4BW91_9FLAO|nr:hypothetical protein PI23P_02022 [Polaribacter irgensii 23-P]
MKNILVLEKKVGFGQPFFVLEIVFWRSIGFLFLIPLLLILKQQ